MQMKQRYQLHNRTRRQILALFDKLKPQAAQGLQRADLVKLIMETEACSYWVANQTVHRMEQHFANFIRVTENNTFYFLDR